MPNDYPDWLSPSPGASQLLVADQALPGAGASFQLDNLGRWSSLFVQWGYQNVAAPIYMTYQFTDPASGFKSSGGELSDTGATTTGPPGNNWTQIPVTGPSCVFRNPSLGNTPHFGVFGSTVACDAPARYDSGQNNYETWFQAAQALLAGTTYNLGPQVLGQQTGGPVYAAFIVGGTTVKGEFLVNSSQAGNILGIPVADTTEFGAPSNQNGYKQMALPNGPYSVQFLCRVAGTGLLRASFYRDR